MAKSMNILFASSECVPFASTGGLGDVVAALPKTATAHGHSCIRVLPYYRSVLEGGYPVEETGIHLKLPIADEHLEADILQSTQETVKTCFVKFDGFFNREGLYGPPGGEYHDNVWRFAFFQKAVVALIDALEKPVDIVHCNDWQTGLIPLYLKHGADGAGRTQTERTVFTIHNLAYQGQFSALDFHVLNLPNSEYSMQGVEFYDRINFLKAGIVAADHVTTVSRTYAKEIQTETQGYGLDKLLNYRADHLTGIVNGVDYEIWNPATDPYLKAHYDETNLAGKTDCKIDLLQRMGLGYDKKVPVVGLVSRLAGQKGIDLIGYAISELVDLGFQFVFLGSGETRYEQMLIDWEHTWPDQVAVHIGFSHKLAHQIEAGTDLFLMPSVFEPCGLNQLYSLKYGTIPVVSNTGGLADTVQPFDGKKGTGFVLKSYDKEGLVEAMTGAKTLWDENPWGWKAMLKRGMKEDFSWESTARKYIKLYEDLKLSR